MRVVGAQGQGSKGGLGCIGLVKFFGFYTDQVGGF